MSGQLRSPLPAIYPRSFTGRVFGFAGDLEADEKKMPLPGNKL